MAVTIASLEQSVMFKLGNRPDLNTPIVAGGPSRIDLWLRDAYINIATEVPQDTNEFTLQFTLVQGIDNIVYPSTVRSIIALTLYRADGTVITVETKDIKYIRRMNNINQGAPSMWAPIAQTIVFRPVPDGNGPYTCVLDVNLKPVIFPVISATTILLPDDWIEPLVYAAAVRGHTDLQEEDKAKAVQSLLYGFTDPTGKYTPGLIENLQTRAQANAPYVDWGVEPQSATIPFSSRRG